MNEVWLLTVLGPRGEAAELWARSSLLDSPVTAWPLVEVVMRRGADTPDELDAVERGLRVAPALDYEAMLVLVEFGARTSATFGRDRLDAQARIRRAGTSRLQRAPPARRAGGRGEPRTRVARDGGPGRRHRRRRLRQPAPRRDPCR